METKSGHPISSLRQRWQQEHFPDSLEPRPNQTDTGTTDESALDELRAPSPASRTNGADAFEDRKRSHSNAKNEDNELTEMGAPSPAHQEPARNKFEGRNESSLSDYYRQQDDRPASGAEWRDHEQPGQTDLKPEDRSDKVEYSSSITELYTISWLIFFSFWGTLARLGVEAITLYPNSPFTSRVLWANLGGSFIIGFLTEDRSLFQQEWGSPKPNTELAAHVKVKKTIPLYIGLATGFCGCFTSFSSFMKDSFLGLTNALTSPSRTTAYEVDPVVASRNGGFSFLALLAILIVEPAVSICALKTGAHFALLVQPVTPTIPLRFCRRVLDPLATILAFGCWLGAVLLSIWPPGNTTHWRFRATFPLIFSPPGCLLRYYLSKYLNSRIPSFPLGTFVANIFGTMVLGMAWDLQHASGIGAAPNASVNACSVLEGIIEGFCGCLTTVSTWVLELDALRRRHAWFYGLTSVLVGLASMIVIMGSMGWTVGFASPMCS